MTATYEKIATTTLGTASATVTFSSISGAYTDLVAVITAKANTSADVYVRCNGDSGTNYSYTGISGSGSAASSFRVSNTSNGLLLDNLGYADNNNNQIILVSFNNYSNTTTYKTSICRSNNAATGVDALVGVSSEITQTENQNDVVSAVGAAIAKGFIEGEQTQEPEIAAAIKSIIYGDEAELIESSTLLASR
jgi:hypothetical protein